jgi:hypothetical protein
MATTGCTLVCPCCHCTQNSTRFIGRTMSVPPSSRLLIRDVLPLSHSSHRYRLCRFCTRFHYHPDHWKASDSAKHRVPGPPLAEEQPVVLPHPPPPVPSRPYRPFDVSTLPPRAAHPRGNRPAPPPLAPVVATDGGSLQTDISPTFTLLTPEPDLQSLPAPPTPPSSLVAEADVPPSLAPSPSLAPLSPASPAAASPPCGAIVVESPRTRAVEDFAMRFSLTFDNGDSEEATPRPPSPEVEPPAVAASANDIPALEAFPAVPCSVPPPPPAVCSPLPVLTHPVTFSQLQQYAAIGHAAAPAVRQLLLGPVDGYLDAAREGMARVVSADVRDRILCDEPDKTQLFTAGHRSEAWWRSQIEQLLAVDRCVRPVVWTEAIRLQHEATGAGVLPMVDYPVYPWGPVLHPGGREAWLEAAMAMGRGVRTSIAGVSVTADLRAERTRVQFPLWMGETADYTGYPRADVASLLGFDRRSWQQERQRDLLRTAELTWPPELKEAGPHFNGDELTVFATSDGVCTGMHVDFIGGMACLIDGFKVWLWCDAGDLAALEWRPGAPQINLARASQLQSFRWSLGGPGISFLTHPDAPHAVVSLTSSLLITWPQTLLPFRQLRSLTLAATNKLQDAIWLVDYERGGFQSARLYVKVFEGFLRGSALRLRQWVEAGTAGWPMVLHVAHGWRAVSPLITELMRGRRWHTDLDADGQTALRAVWTEFIDLFEGVVEALRHGELPDVLQLVRAERWERKEDEDERCQQESKQEECFRVVRTDDRLFCGAPERYAGKRKQTSRRAERKGKR